MATITAVLGKRTAFTGPDTVVCALSKANRQGIQVIAEGFTLDQATFSITYPGGQSEEPEDIETTGRKSGILGRRMAMEQIQVSGLPAGNYHITFIQL